jgi:hypothetical protein
MIDWQKALEHKLVLLANAALDVKLPVVGSRETAFELAFVL